MWINNFIIRTLRSEYLQTFVKILHKYIPKSFRSMTHLLQKLSRVKSQYFKMWTRMRSLEIFITLSLASVNF